MPKCSGVMFLDYLIDNELSTPKLTKTRKKIPVLHQFQFSN